ncbi:MAG: ABC transporter substrate-binding protein [Lentisphaeria bacterium]|nr:ABC transporter substrate-binding protein [Lentisphaeria bacterium]
MWKRALFAVLPVAVLLILPFALRPSAPKGTANTVTQEAEKLVIVTPHTEQIRYEFDRAFRLYYQKKYGKDVKIDWRNVGGTSDIVRYIADRFEAAFRLEYEKSGKEWTNEVSKNYKNYRVDPAKCEERRMFLNSSCGIGIDIFFGGGTYDHNRFGRIGIAIPGGVEKRHPEWFKNAVFPAKHAGETLRDAKGRYYGVCLSSFGIAYNPDRFRDLGLPAPKGWKDLTDPRLFRRTEVADPTKSGSITKCYEMILQQCMMESAKDLNKGWADGLMRIKLIAANARCVTDSAGKLVRDVSSGAAAAGMCIDFYGFSEAAFTKKLSGGDDRLIYVMPENGSCVSADPVQMLRGAPNPHVAKEFLDFLLSKEGQSIWLKKAETENGPKRTALLRPCVRKDVITNIPAAENSLPGYNPYEASGRFQYRGDWTGRYFSLIRVLIKCIALDPIDDLQKAWQAVIENGGPEANPEAMALIRKLPFEFSEAAAAGKKLSGTAAEAAAVRRQWMEEAAANYRKAAAIAKGGKK